MRIENKVAIVTGGSGGLGESVVRLLNMLKAKVAIWDIDSKSGEKLAKELGNQVIFIETDVSAEDSVKNALKITLNSFGNVNILVNGAGIDYGKMIITSKTVHPLADFEKVIRINLNGTFNVSRLVAKEMSTQDEIEGERGVIIHVASLAGFEGQRGQTAYSSSKGGIIGLTLPMARDLASYGIRVNTIAPGLFKTRMGEAVPQEILNKILKEILSKRLGNPEEFAHAVRFLIENTYMNGTVLKIDCGAKSPNI